MAAANTETTPDPPDSRSLEAFNVHSTELEVAVLGLSDIDAVDLTRAREHGGCAHPSCTAKGEDYPYFAMSMARNTMGWR
jgi:hypothetical protein